MRLLFAMICGASLCAMAACSPSVDFERMRQQQRVDPYSASALFQDGMAMRRPPAGAVAVAADEAPAADIERGRQQFDIFCAVCHGADGSGQSVMSSNLPQEPSMSLLRGPATQLTAATLFESISQGKDRMPGFAWAMTAADRYAVVAYVQMLQQRAGVAAAAGRCR
jgi:mono/diheme cytochrome c family protein